MWVKSLISVTQVKGLNGIDSLQITDELIERKLLPPATNFSNPLMYFS